MGVLISLPRGGSVREVLNVVNGRHVFEVIVIEELDLILSDFIFQKASIVVLQVQMQILRVEAPVGLQWSRLYPIIILIAVVQIILRVRVIAKAGLV